MEKALWQVRAGLAAGRRPEYRVYAKMLLAPGVVNPSRWNTSQRINGPSYLPQWVPRERRHRPLTTQKERLIENDASH